MTPAMADEPTAAEPKGWGVRTLIMPTAADLTAQEARLFDALYRRGVVSRGELLRAMWGEGEYLQGTQAVVKAVSRMRQKIAPDWKIDTLPGKGYILRRQGQF